MSKKRIYIGVGHGGSDPGACANGLFEKDLTLRTATYLYNYLKTGFDVKISRTSDIDSMLTTRIREANIFKADLALDIHFNAGGGTGFEVYHTITGNSEGSLIASAIEKEVKTIINSRGLKTKENSMHADYYGFIRLTQCPSLILEGSFVDNVKDAEWLKNDSNLRALAEAYARGIYNYYHINFTCEKMYYEKSLYKVQVGAFNDESNAIALRDKLIKQGYDAYVKKE